MSFYDWLLFLHVASGFAMVAALVVFWGVGFAARNVDRPVDSLRYFRIVRPANGLIIAGTIGTLVFGIWLAIDADAYSIFDGWIVAALVLWLISLVTGIRGGRVYEQGQKLAKELAGQGSGDQPSTELRTLLQDRQAMWLNVVSSVAVLLIVVDMIYKPGA